MGCIWFGHTDLPPGCHHAAGAGRPRRRPGPRQANVGTTSLKLCERDRFGVTACACLDAARNRGQHRGLRTRDSVGLRRRESHALERADPRGLPSRVLEHLDDRLRVLELRDQRRECVRFEQTLGHRLRLSCRDRRHGDGPRFVRRLRSRSALASPTKASCVVASSWCRALCPRVPDGCLRKLCSAPGSSDAAPPCGRAACGAPPRADWHPPYPDPARDPKTT